MSDKIKVTLIRSLIGRPEKQRRVVKSLGLRKLNSSVIHDDTDSIRGMVRAINHLVNVEKVEA
jgi:large subunit ribosomal protein L30